MLKYWPHDNTTNSFILLADSLTTQLRVKFKNLASAVNIQRVHDVLVYLDFRK